MKRKDIILKTATRLFADQGFDATTTLQIAAESGVTEPLIYYHFKGKNDLFTSILEPILAIYFERMEALDGETETEFEKIDGLIRLHFEMVERMPQEFYLIASACPARLKDPDDICSRGLVRQREIVIRFLSACLDRGIASGEFRPVPVATTVNLLLIMITGLLRHRGLKLVDIQDLREVAIDFSRRALLA